METRTTERRGRKARSRIEPALFRRNGEHRPQGDNMIYSDLSHTERYIFDTLDTYICNLTKEEIKHIVQMIESKYLKGGNKKCKTQ